MNTEAQVILVLVCVDDTTEFHTLLPSDGVVGSKTCSSDAGATNGNASKGILLCYTPVR